MLFYLPEDKRMGDIIPYYEEGEYKLFYLGNGWSSVTTKDQLHFYNCYTTPIHGGTGSIVKADGLYHMFYCQFTSQPYNRQFSCHATSPDLIHWTELPEYTFMPDDEIYEMSDWRDPHPVYAQLAQLIAENHIAVWRNHDHMHSAPKDEIMIGVLKALGWDVYMDKDACRFQQIITIPETTLRQLALHLKDRLRLSTGRIVGNPEAKVSRIAFCSHIFPSWNEEERKPTKLIGREDIDVLIPGEMIDWTVVPYIRDAVQLGMNKAIIQVGHFNLEEPGMEYMAEKMAGIVPELPVYFIPSGDPYFFL